MTIFIQERVVKHAFSPEMSKAIRAIEKMFEKYSEEMFIVGSEGRNHVVFRKECRSMGDVRTAMRGDGFHEPDWDLISLLEPRNTYSLTYNPDKHMQKLQAERRREYGNGEEEKGKEELGQCPQQ